MILNELWAESCTETNGHLDSLCDYGKRGLQYCRLSSPSADSVLTPVEMKLVNDTAPASSTVPISTPSLLFDPRATCCLTIRYC